MKKMQFVLTLGGSLGSMQGATMQPIRRRGGLDFGCNVRDLLDIVSLLWLTCDLLLRLLQGELVIQCR